MTSKEIIKQLLTEDQAESILRFWPSLIASEKQMLIKQVENLDQERLKQQLRLVHQSSHPVDFEPFEDFAHSGNPKDLEMGKQLIRSGKVGCIILAGGQGTRLGFEGPKGLYPTSLVRHKSLFQICFEKVLAAGKQVGRRLMVSVMTSPENDTVTRKFLSDHDYFGLKPSQVSFFSQNNLPLLDKDGHLFLEKTYKFAEGPDGNGQCFHNFVKAGLWEDWKNLGIQYINVILIDNPLADPFDAELIGFHTRKHAHITVKCTQKVQPEEKVGVMVREGEHARIIEYSELSDIEKYSMLDGRLKYCCANLSLFCFSMDFAGSVVEKHPHLPLHKAWKATKYVNEMGVTQASKSAIAWKFEHFIFDLTRYTSKVAALLYPREACFAPLKNYSGQDSITSVQMALQKRDRDIYQAVTGLSPPQHKFELAPEFYYPTADLLAKWKGRSTEDAYIEG